MNTIEARHKAIQGMKDALERSRSSGLALAEERRNLAKQRNLAIIAMESKGMSASAVANHIKSEQTVAEAQYKVDCAEVIYKADVEEVNVYKLEARLMEADIERDWRNQ